MKRYILIVAALAVAGCGVGQVPTSEPVDDNTQGLPALPARVQQRLSVGFVADRAERLLGVGLRSSVRRALSVGRIKASGPR